MVTRRSACMASVNLSTATEALLNFLVKKKSKLAWYATLKDLKTFISKIIYEKAAESQSSVSLATNLKLLDIQRMKQYISMDPNQAGDLVM